MLRDHTGLEIAFPSRPSERNSAKEGGTVHDLCIVPARAAQIRVLVWGSILSWHTPMYLNGSVLKQILWGPISKMIPFYNFIFLFLQGTKKSQQSVS